MAATQKSHIGIEVCIRRTRESLYWPRMTVELKEYIQRCDVCLTHRNQQGKEPLAQHDFAARPWSEVTVDLCQLEGRTRPVISADYSNLLEVARVTAITARSIIKELDYGQSEYLTLLDCQMLPPRAWERAQRKG